MSDTPATRKNIRRSRSSEPEESRPSQASRPSGPNRRVTSAPPDETPREPLFARLRARFAGFSFARVRVIAVGILRLALVALVLVGAAAAARLGERYVRTSPAFAIRTLEVRGLSRLTRDEVLLAAAIREGQNVFDMPPEDVRARLERHPWIARASVRRRLPGSVAIEVVERRAVALLLVDDLYLVGEDATVFKTRERRDPHDLPVVTLTDSRRWLSDRAALSTLLLDLVALIQDYRRFGLAGHGTLEELHVEDDDGITLYLGRDATRVALGRAPFDRKLRRLRVLFEELGRRDATPAYVLLDHERRTDRVVVRLRETVVPLPLMDVEAPPAAIARTSARPG